MQNVLVQVVDLQVLHFGLRAIELHRGVHLCNTELRSLPPQHSAPVPLQVWLPPSVLWACTSVMFPGHTTILVIVASREILK